MDNVIEVTNDFKDGCKDVERLYEHITTLYNVTQNEDITGSVDLTTLKCISEKTGRFGIISANTIKFNVEIKNSEDIAQIIAKDDVIEFRNEFNNESILVATGTVQKTPTTYRNLKQIYQVTVYDRIKEGLEAKFDRHIVKLGWYVCNNAETSQSLAHFLADEAGLPSSELQFEDVTDSNDEHIVIPYAHFEKGNRVMEEFSLLVKSVRGALFANHLNEVILTSPFNENDFDDIGFIFDNNITNRIDKSIKKAEYDSVSVIYDSFDVLERQVCWMYYKKDYYDANNDKAHMRLEAGKTSAWIRINWVTQIAVNIESDTPETLIDDDMGNDMSDDFTYDIEVDNTGGKVRFHNLNDTEDIYIQRFKIYGQPLRKLSGNETTYTEKTKSNKPLEVENKFIQSRPHAKMVAKYTHYIDCLDRETYKFSAFYTPFLAIGNKVGINKQDIDKTALINKFTHSSKQNRLYTQVVLEEFLSYPDFTGILENTEASYDFVEDKSDFIEEEIEGDEGAPVLVPTGLEVVGSFKHIWVSWDETTRGDNLGWNVWASNITDSVNKKYFVKSNGFMFEAETGTEWEIQVSQVTKAGESDKTDIVTASTKKISEADYEELSIVNAVIANGAIDNAKIANLSADKINAGTFYLTEGMKIENEDGSVIITSDSISVNGSPGASQSYVDENLELRLKPEDAYLWHFDGHITSTDGKIAEVI